ncbi:MAG: glycosyltransferase family 2 protein [Anaerolineales bacterium]|nr:glycosyltransferase family 2 protein [Anaerolineales bacterium]
MTHNINISDAKKPFLSVVVPLYNEEETITDTLPAIHKQCSALDVSDFEIVAIDDGSSDATLDILHNLCKYHNQIRIIAFNRNFGKEAAIHAGLVYAKGDAVIVMDGDGQHPEQLLPKMIKHWEEGAKVVVACKAVRGQESIISKFSAFAFYWLFKNLTKLDIENISDFMLLDRVVVDHYCQLPERRRFFRGMIIWMGFTTAKIYFEVPPRVSGNSSWSKVALFKLGSTAISSFTSSPLHLISILAVVYFACTLIFGGIALFDKLSGRAVTGFTTVIILILMTGTFIMFGLGQLGLYIERMYEELKNRPPYFINTSKSTIDFNQDLK